MRGCLPHDTLSLTFAQDVQYYRHDAVSIGQNIVVPEAQNTPAKFFQTYSAHNIIRIVGMLAAIGFNNQMIFSTGKIGNEFANGMLTSKTIALKATITQEIPEAIFGVS